MADTPVTQADIGLPPENIDRNFMMRAMTAINLVLRSTADNITAFKENVVATFTYSAYGGMSSADTAQTDITNSWETLEFDTVGPVPRGMTINLVNNSIAWDLSSLNAISISFTLTHNEAQGSREFRLRIYDLTKSQPFKEIPIGIARNQTVTNFSTVMPIEVDAGYENDEVVFQVYSDDAIIVVSWDLIRVWSWNVGEFRGNFDVPLVATVSGGFSKGFSRGFS